MSSGSLSDDDFAGKDDSILTALDKFLIDPFYCGTANQKKLNALELMLVNSIIGSSDFDEEYDSDDGSGKQRSLCSHW